MIKARRIGHATFETPDLERQIVYYTHVAGLALIARDSERAFFAARTGQLAIELQRAERPRCAKLSFEVAPNEDFADVARRLTAEGIASDLRSDSFPGTPKVLTFQDPKGTTIELFTEWSALVREQSVGGIGPLQL